MLFFHIRGERGVEREEDHSVLSNFSFMQSLVGLVGISVQPVIHQSIWTGLASGIPGIAFRTFSLHTSSTCSTLGSDCYVMNPFNRPYSFHYAPQGDESDGLSEGHSPRVSVYEVEIAWSVDMRQAELIWHFRSLPEYWTPKWAQPLPPSSSPFFCLVHQSFRRPSFFRWSDSSTVQLFICWG